MFRGIQLAGFSSYAHVPSPCLPKLVVSGRRVRCDASKLTATTAAFQRTAAYVEGDTMGFIRQQSIQLARPSPHGINARFESEDCAEYRHNTGTLRVTPSPFTQSRGCHNLNSHRADSMLPASHLCASCLALSRTTADTTSSWKCQKHFPQILFGPISCEYSVSRAPTNPACPLPPLGFRHSFDALDNNFGQASHHVRMISAGRRSLAADAPLCNRGSRSLDAAESERALETISTAYWKPAKYVRGDGPAPQRCRGISRTDFFAELRERRDAREIRFNKAVDLAQCCVDSLL